MTTVKPGTRRVLIADDNRDVADSIGMLLGMLGHETHVAYDCPSSLTLARSLLPHVVFLDLSLSETDDYAIVQKLREELAPAKLHVVALTGFVDESHRQRAFDAGIDAFLAKPAGMRDFETVLASVGDLVVGVKRSSKSQPPSMSLGQPEPTSNGEMQHACP
jgi:CheY-like chemotaxis protein